VEVILSLSAFRSPAIPDLGGMIAEGRQIVYQAPWIMALPMPASFLSVIGFNLLGDGLRTLLDPVQRRLTAALTVRDLHVAIGPSRQCYECAARRQP